ncbi:Msm operon regulatory protein [Paenibacillus sp. J31TS4]|uniref:AraC family transcriptional regulator n=1 Tax=Paenibacillus sp. J31TS4 TaxID=2807195 RepID=UPI001B0D5B1F|nr:AraC family transcriptional regulator [Paenibacillus sp. J31TS4]GIP37871.1 Msm operon regulatory protein [Paenibacillus sp. J31TS4]
MKHGPIYHFPSADAALPLTISFIGINYCHADYSNVRNKSRITVIGYVLSGRGFAKIDQALYRPQKGDVFLLPAGRNHHVFADPEIEEPWSYIWLNIDGELALRLMDAYRLLDSGTVAGTSVEDLFERAIRMAESETAGQMLSELPVLFHQILIRLAAGNQKNGSAYSYEVRKIKQYLDNQIQCSFESDQLCKHVGLSYRQINRLFKKETDTTVYNYVLTKKIESARMMLIDTELTVNEISYRLGYSDPHYFSNLFKKRTGVSPSAYRLKQKDLH